MKKIIYFSLITTCVLLFKQTILAADPTCAQLKGTCHAVCISGDDETTTTDCVVPTPKCCYKKESVPGGNNTNNKGFGFGKTIEDVATKAGYSPSNEPTLDQRISSIISIFLSLLGVIFMGLMIYGGYNWMTAQGDEQKVDKAKDTIRAAIIGLVIVIAAYAVSVFVISRLWGTST